jgi:hypothetical protein
MKFPLTTSSAVLYTTSVSLMMLMMTLQDVTIISAFSIVVPTHHHHHRTANDVNRVNVQQQLHMIDRNVANMIDQEYYRQHHKEEWIAQTQKPTVDTSTLVNEMTMNESIVNHQQHIRDVKLANTNPQQYCADRCIATGNCDVYEDLYVLLCRFYFLSCVRLFSLLNIHFLDTFVRIELH